MKSTSLFLLFSCTICFFKHSNGARILGVFPAQGKSHWIMFKEVLESLAEAGHQVDVIGPFPRKKPLDNYNDIINLAGSAPSVTGNVTYDYLQYLSSPSLKAVIESAGTALCELLELPELQNFIKHPPNDPPYDLVIGELFFASCYFAFGRHLNVPVVALSSAALWPHVNEPFGNPFNPAMESFIAERPVSHMNFWQRLINTLVVSYSNFQVKYHSEVQNDIVRKYFGSDMPDIDHLEREVSLVLVNSHYIFHGVRPLTPAIVEVAGLHVRDDNKTIPAPDLQRWLDDSKHGFIYFTLGSMVTIESFPKAVLAEVYSAFARVSPIRILMKVANPEELPPGLPENVLTLTWAPQVQVLNDEKNLIPEHKNIRGFLTHGGLMGLQEAVTFGVPLIGVPLFGDQPGNIDICVRREIAVALDYKNLNAANIAAAIDAVTNNPKYKKHMMAVSKQFLDRPSDPRSTAVFWIEYILKHGPDALRSPAVNLKWWELALLDVYGSILATILLLLYALKLILAASVDRIFYSNNPSTSSKKIN